MQFKAALVFNTVFRRSPKFTFRDTLVYVTALQLFLLNAGPPILE